MPRWSNPVRLSDYLSAPTRSGVYEIGFCRGKFSRRYIGKAEGPRGIQGRLWSHDHESHNQSICGYRFKAERDNLYCRWQVVKDAREREARLLNRKFYAWNRRIEKL